jgi:hypothetical protein
MHFTNVLSISALALASTAMAEVWTLKDTFVGPSFLTEFTHETIDDPTHGRVDYVDQATALANNLTFTTPDTIIMRADNKKVVDPAARGRQSVRIKSNKAYLEHAVVLDVRHMPQGCSTWPSAWEVDEAKWPANGEIDIIEGANDITPNTVTLHTSPGCTQPAGRLMQGDARLDNCDTTINQSQGCGVGLHSTASYGKEFNANGGGFFVMQRTENDIKVWFFARNDGSAPASVSNPGQTLDTTSFPQPGSVFTNQSCDFKQHFGALNIVINLTLCGDWAGSLFNANGCPGSCVDLVNQQPAAFNDAFWDIAGVRVYE